MHREIATDAVAGAVIVIKAGVPQWAPCECVQRRTGGTFREPYRGQRDVAFQHAGEAVLHLRAWCAHDHGARDVGGAVFILGARIDQINLIPVDLAIAGGGDAVMGDRGVFRRPRDGIKTEIGQCAGCAAVPFQRFGHLNLIQMAVRCFACHPGEETGECRTIADMGLAHALNLHRVLAGLGQLDGIAGAFELCTGLLQAVEHGGGRAARIGKHGLALQAIEGRGKRFRRVQAHGIAEML